MPRDNTSSLLDQLDELKTDFTPAGARRLNQLLARLAAKKINDTEKLVRYHELLLFVRAYPHNASLLRAAENELRSFAKRVSFLEQQEIDVAPLLHPEVSGIHGTSVIDTFGFFIVRGLLERHASEVEIDWEWFEDENRLAATWPRFMPLLEEDAYVEANVPYREWLAAARGRRSELVWLIEQFDKLSKPEKERAELYDSQQLYVRWTPRYDASRTGMRMPARKYFYHREPLIQRRDIDLRKQITQPSPALEKLSPADAENAIDMARDASTTRYRELYGFTHGDPKQVYRAELGRGVEMFLIDLLPEMRLPLRTSHAAMIYKNGVPIGYFEGLALFERMESGFNLYYTFREGEAAWLYARTLNVLHHFAGVTAFSLDPYQIGFENEEGIESGAFWFYRKLGFRPTQPETLQLARKEEEKIRTRKEYRTPAATLRKLARSPMILELDERRSGDWDNFQLRKIGFKAQRGLSEEEKRALEQVIEGKRDEVLRRVIIDLGS